MNRWDQYIAVRKGVVEAVWISRRAGVIISIMPNYLKLIPEWLFEVIRGNPRRAARRHSTTPLLVIGHRGSPCFASRNTMASFQRAVEQDGANGLECDLCLTKDEQIVLWHD